VTKCEITRDETRGEIDPSLPIEGIEQRDTNLLGVGGQVIERLAAIARNAGWRYIASNWYGLGAPKNTLAEVVANLNKEINAGLADPRIKARFADLGGTPLVGSPADFSKYIAEETEKWAKVIRSANIKPE
jgi:hypothetical protein